MSMTSALIDKLNKSADEWNGSNMFELARMCREAADTITELRGALQVASVDYRHLSEENAKLREQGARLFDKTLELGTENAKLREERREYQATIDSLVDECADHKAENAKLRELLQRLLTEYRYMRVRPRAVYLQHEERMRAIEEEMRELGIEVES